MCISAGQESSGHPSSGASGDVFSAVVCFRRCRRRMRRGAERIMAHGKCFDIFRRLEQQRASEPVLPVSHLVVGLGNTGREYVHTRHNTGFLCLDEVCRHWNTATDRAKFRSLVGEAVIAGARCLPHASPARLANASGLAVAEAARFYHIDPPISSLSVTTSTFLSALCACAPTARTAVSAASAVSSRSWAPTSSPAFRIGVGSKPHP